MRQRRRKSAPQGYDVKSQMSASKQRHMAVNKQRLGLGM